MKKITLQIEGMTCGGCATHIKNIVEKLPGIIEANVSFHSKKGTFIFDEAKLSKEELISAINTIGPYKVVGEIPDNNHYDLIIIGGGSAAFSAAIQAEALGISTLMVNEGLPFGGTCVNVGCVPSKYLIRAAENIYYAKNPKYKAIFSKGITLNFPQLIQDKKKLVNKLQKEKYLDVVKDFKYLTLLKGWAKFIDNHTIKVNETKFTADKILIATGSSTNIPDIEGLNEVGYLTNQTLFNLEELPKSLTILGAGFVAMEIAQAYTRFGTKIKIIHFTDRPLRFLTKDLTDILVQQFQKENIQLLPNYKAFKFEKKNGKILIHCKLPDGSSKILQEENYILVATGRKPNTHNLNIERTNIKLTDNGHIVVNSRMQTNIENIYAAGDVANTPAFVYTAAEEGKIAVLNAFTNADKEIDYSALPWVIFTDPQIAGVGLDEKQAEQNNIPYQVSVLELKHVPKALVSEDTQGFVKLIRNPETDSLIGARLIGHEIGELVQLLSIAIKYNISTKELAEMLYPYLTLTEAIKLASISFEKDVSKLSCCAT